MMKQKILLISHCYFNDGSKLKNSNSQELAEERIRKRTLLKHLLDNGVELIQLPCPEFLLYGANRWGHASSQFDSAGFRKGCREMLEPYLLQIEEYLSHEDRFEVLGVLGIDGSPSCGVHFTYDGDWGGEFSSNPNLPETLQTIHKVETPGIFMRIFMECLQEKGYSIPFYGLDDFQNSFQ